MMRMLRKIRYRIRFYLVRWQIIREGLQREREQRREIIRRMVEDGALRSYYR